MSEARAASPWRRLRHSLRVRLVLLFLLLALAMQPEGGDLTHEIMVGLPLLPAEFNA